MVEFFTEYMREFEARLEKRFEKIDQRFESVEAHLAHHDDLLETIATEVSETQNILAPLVPKQTSHEERISRLERGYSRLILRS